MDKTLDKLQTYYGNAIRANFKPETLTPQEKKERDGTLKRKDLDAVFLDFLLPQFQSLSEYSLLICCPPGYLQNANESLSSLVRKNAPKHWYKGARVVEIAVMPAAMSFNTGAATSQDAPMARFASRK
ncbi:Hypothetical predicted protein [Paramuricea clavata]|uniref:Uncharacterized protein n=1 Tax=Paramuricea clavata TaxID=317549 RepID=A0A7D9IN37_PARCT|nr:Hypothetical predicted protein [Paramuricea clavata]